jgi:putative ABC transport system permease protein
MLKLLRMLVVRPLARDPLRTVLTIVAVALGVAVVIGIELAGQAAAGSFESSLTSVVGKTDLQISANGGMDEKWIGVLAGLPINARFAPVMEGRIGAIPVYGVDMPGQAGACATRGVGAVVGEFRVVCRIDAGDAEFAAIDIAEAQRVFGRYGKLDRIDVFVSAREDFAKAEGAIRGALPAGVLVDKPGARSNENQRMLRAFRWNLQVLSYISLVVGAFLIYNTISISVVRRRAEIGILRAVGTARGAVFALFLAEAMAIGAVGAALGIAMGRAMAEGLVGLIAGTVNSLYASSRPAAIHLTVGAAVGAGCTGLGIALLSAFGPAWEAMKIAPVEAMGRGSRETTFRLRTRRNLAMAVVFAGLSWAAAVQDPVAGRPLFGYLSVVLSIGAAACVAPSLIVGTVGLTRGVLRGVFGAAGLLAGRSLTASLGRTSIVVTALATAIAMMASVGIMVGSFRETVVVWLDSQLRADIYIRGSGPGGAGVYPPIAGGVGGLVARVEGVAAVDVFSALEIRYEGQRASLGGGDVGIARRYGRMRFLYGQDRDAVLRGLAGTDNAIVTQTFANKHKLHPGDRITIPLGERRVALTVTGVYYDYTSERGFVIVDRATLLKYLPDLAATNLAIYLAPGVDAVKVRGAIQRVTAGLPLDIALNEKLRAGAVEIFDRTFAVTYALEGVAILVAMLGAANSLLALVLDRRREFGLLRYLGAAPAQIRRMVLVEAGLLGFLANLLGLGLGFALSFVLIYVINEQSFGWTIQFHAPLGLLGAALSLVWCVTIVAGLYPARVAACLNPIDVVHIE